MGNLRDIKRRINSIENIKKITRAMKLVAASRLKRAEKGAEKSRPYFMHMLKTAVVLGQECKKSEREFPDIFLDSRDKKEKRGYLVFTGDRGLSGPYDSRVLKQVENHMNAQSTEKDLTFIVIGKKGKDYLLKKNYDLSLEFLHLDEYPTFLKSQEIAEQLFKLCRSDNISELFMVYTEFESVIRQKVVLLRAFPFPEEKTILSMRGSTDTHSQKEDSTKEEEGGPLTLDSSEDQDYTLTTYEPQIEELIELFLPLYLEAVIHGALKQAKASEFGSRMRAMESATDNAEEMIDDLRLKYNRQRQEEITKELSEIVGGAEALER